MGTGKKLLIEVGQTVGLDDEVALFMALSELGRKWADLTGDVDGFSSAAALIRAVAEGPTDPNVTAAFAKLGADGELAALAKAAGKIKALLDDVPETLAKLLDPIGKFDESNGSKDVGLLRWPLDKTIGAGGGQDASKASYALSVEGNAVLMIEAGDSWPYSDPMPGPLLRMRVEGGLKPKASATLPFSIGSVSASADASVACALEYYFAAPNPHSLYALAVAERIGDLPDPFDFDSLWDAFAGSDLTGVHYQFDGKVAANVAVSVADSGNLGSLIRANFGATVTVGVELGGEFFLTLRAGPRGVNGSPSIVATLSRERSKAGELGLKLGATVDLSALSSRVHKVLAGALGEWDEVLSDIKPYLSPGTWVQSKASSLIEKEAEALIKDKALRGALVRDLQGAIGIGDPDETALVEWLTGQLTGAVDAAESWAKDQVKATISAVDLLGRNLPAFAQPELRPTLEASAGKLIAHASDALEKEVASLFTAQGSELGKALHRIGAAADKKVKTLDAALESVRNLIDKYDRLFRKLVAATEDSARTNVSAAIQIEESRLQSSTLEVTGTFLARSDAARQVFHALTRGDFRSLLRLVEIGGGADFALDASRSSLTRYSSSKSKLGIEVVAVGFGITGSELLTSEASVMVDGTGKVQVDTKATLQKKFSGVDADREIELVSSFSLVGARLLAQAGAPPAVERGIGLAVSMGHIDDSLKRLEVERFVESLVNAGMVAPGALAKAQSTFTRWAGTPGSNGKLSGALLVKLSLDRPALSALLGLDTVANAGSLPDHRRREIIRTGFEALRQASAADRSAMDATIGYLAHELPNRTLDELLADPNRTRRSLTYQMGTGAPRMGKEHEPFYDAAVLSNGLYEMVEQFRQIYFSTPEGQADNNPYTWSPNDYRGAQQRAVKAVGGWLQLNSILFWTNSKVHPRTLAFLDTLATLGRIDLGTSLSLVMWRKDESPEAVVLSPADL